jgi:hypothetical protein
MDSLPARVSVLEQLSIEREKRHEAFMTKTETTLAELLTRSDAVQAQFQEWATIRKTLYWIGSAFVASGACFGWFLHQFVDLRGLMHK